MIHCRGGGSPPVLTFAFSIFISPCLCASVFNKKRITLIFCNPFLIIVKQNWFAKKSEGSRVHPRGRIRDASLRSA